MVMHDNEFDTKENTISSKDKIEPQHIQCYNAGIQTVKVTQWFDKTPYIMLKLYSLQIVKQLFRHIYSRMTIVYVVFNCLTWFYL